jgi:hypothetical protein
MNRNLVIGLTLAIFVILACSVTSVPPTTAPPVVPNTAAAPRVDQNQMATFVAQRVEAQQPAVTDTPVPELSTPTTVAPVLPKAPANFFANATCTKLIAHSYTVYKYVFVANLTWDAQSSNATGFEINKDGVLLATLDANTKEYKDTATITTPYKRYTASATYTIQSINAAGKSEPVEVFVTLTCR